jgi:hypoxanthine phosphoribosyltransferase
MIETGITIKAVIEELSKFNPASIRFASCFLKKGFLRNLIKIIKVNKQSLSKLIILH